jgi:hypothetical protein
VTRQWSNGGSKLVMGFERESKMRKQEWLARIKK